MNRWDEKLAKKLERRRCGFRILSLRRGGGWKAVSDRHRRAARWTLLTEVDLKHMKRTPRAKIIRRALELTQEEFAARYHIPIGTLRDWEQGRTEPDQPAQAYLALVARDPDRVNRILNREPH